MIADRSLVYHRFADRKTDLGKKVVSEIIIFDGVSGEGRKDEDIKPCMAMKIVDKPSGSDGGVAGGGGNTNVGAGPNSNPEGEEIVLAKLERVAEGRGKVEPLSLSKASQRESESAYNRHGMTAE